MFAHRADYGNFRALSYSHDRATSSYPPLVPREERAELKIEATLDALARTLTEAPLLEA
jgi:hypothetical protein